MSQEKEQKNTKRKKSFLRWLLFFIFLSGGAGGGYIYYLKPKSLNDLKTKVKSNLKQAIQKGKALLKRKGGNQIVVLTIKGHTIKAEVADTAEKRRIGFMGRKKIPEGYGMIFVYPEQEELSFWMKNTFVPLSLAYINAEGEIVKIVKMDVEEPKKEGEEYKTYPSEVPCKYALEVPQGWFQKMGIQVGDKVEGLKDLKGKE
ncbi:MAG: DUF192 domain-containing protein [Planctomycetota bacterium]|nr:MAG: DUF192 domain-containing protein [Planctomycetota bacterium]